MNLPQKAKAFITSKFRGQEIYEINKEKTKLWIKIVNTSYTEDFKVKKKTPLGFLVIEPEHLKDKNGRKKTKTKGLPKNWEQPWRSYWQKKKLPTRRLSQ